VVELASGYCDQGKLAEKNALLSLTAGLASGGWTLRYSASVGAKAWRQGDEAEERCPTGSACACSRRAAFSARRMVSFSGVMRPVYQPLQPRLESLRYER